MLNRPPPIKHPSQVHVCLPAGTPAVDRDMFALMWSPTVAAVSVVLDHAEDMGVVRLALDGLQCAARLASYHRLDQVRACGWAKTPSSVQGQAECGAKQDQTWQ